MTPGELSGRISKTFGDAHGALKSASDTLPINYDNLRQMLSGRRPVAEWLAERFDEIDRLARIESPPASLHPDADRDEPCCAALEPHLDELMRRAIAAGWQEGEVIVAALGWAIHSCLDGAGLPATLQMLDDARELAEMQGALNAGAHKK
ncbi:hypothetical protein [Acetobacter sicerae]|uniref:hypothetical protein n=1 Tax=Acetobacter sicerae TaxID=85325 RepID=UPI00156B218B|nr:hypothetical protein [Acetobacter sicerae]NHN93850.1 hypothetical protein [Acetobacter sicerae]